MNEVVLSHVAELDLFVEALRQQLREEAAAAKAAKADAAAAACAASAFAGKTSARRSRPHLMAYPGGVDKDGGLQVMAATNTW